MALGSGGNGSRGACGVKAYRDFGVAGGFGLPEFRGCGWVGLPGLRWRVGLGLPGFGRCGWLGKGLASDQGNAVYHIPTVGEADHGNDGKPLVQATAGIADSGYCYGGFGGSRRYMPGSGFGRGLAWEEEIGVRLRVLARLRILGLLLVWGGLGHGLCLRDSLRARNRGIRRAVG